MPSPNTESPPVIYESSGGPVRSDQALYVERGVDHEFTRMLERRRDVFVITAPRQTGKTSLWVKTQHTLKDKGITFGTIDFREVFGLPEDSTRMARGWTETLFRALCREFRLDLGDLGKWLAAQGEMPTTNLISTFFSEFLRSRLQGAIVVAFDEIDVVQLYSYFTDSLFEAVRVLAARRDELDLSFVLIGINPPENLLKSLGGSAFNIVAKQVDLRDFDPEDNAVIAAWAEGYPATDKKERLSIAAGILTATGGQPYLTACLFDEARSENVQSTGELAPFLSDRIARAKDGDWRRAHFNSPRDIIVERPDLAFRVIAAYEKALKGPIAVKTLGKEVRASLLTSGLVRFDPKDEKHLVIKSDIYRNVFDKAWAKTIEKELGEEVFSSQLPGVAVKLDAPRKRICIINTGGMISTELQPDGKYAIPPDLTRFFRKFPELNSIAEVTAVALMAKDSSDMNPDDWETLADAIFARRYVGFDGFVVAHGTDTLPHTASAIAFALGEGLRVPVVFVGAQVGTDVIHGDARINLTRAVAVATRNVPEVVAVVGDQIHRGVRVQKKDDFRFDGMHSPTWQPLGTIADDIDIRPQDLRKIDRRREMELRNKFSRGVFKIDLYPGLNPDFLMPLLKNPTLDGIIIETLGIGNVPTEGHWSLISFIKAATERYIPVMLASQFPIQPRMTANYEPAGPPLAAGALAALNMAPPAAVTKFMWVLPQIQERVDKGDLPIDRKISEIKRMMETDYVGELDVIENGEEK
ncbi:asparaginase domain-containing protein [Rhodobium gokarnense]|uniref:L-asparaginase type I n=1 Tax=Rhodobium gokarnense TaxID=364296 RepID=A0ABT3HEN6_9HYPH|nr:asparaginase domain-containing protein [Rhodobium gokarnense]MCW2308863.1 L-asparaginase type I [Rhodobium gokarnense]